MQTSLQRIHPLVAAASVSIILVSMLGVATLTGVLAPSNSQTTAATGVHPVVGAALVAKTALAPAPAPTTAPTAAGATGAQLAVGTPTAPVAANSLLGAARPGDRPLTVRETLAPGETLIAPATTPAAALASVPVPAPSSRAAPANDGTSAPAAASAPARSKASTDRNAQVAVIVPTPRLPRVTAGHPYDGSGLRSSRDWSAADQADGAPPLRHSRRRAAPQSQPVAGIDGSPSEPPTVQRIVPVYRDQRMSEAVTVPETSGYSGETGAAGPGTSGPIYRRMNRGDAGNRAMLEPIRRNDTESPGPATRFGSTLGRTLGDGIDRTISAIADVLSGVATVPQSSQPGPAYGAVPGER